MPINTKPQELEIEVFKSGENTDSEGDTKLWTNADLETIANTYNEKIAEDPGTQAPIVKGHPETDDPAYGWVEKLKVVGNTLKAKIKLVSQFADEVKQEMFKKVSIALYPDLMLRHIGFLGAAQPAVKGLVPVKFSSNDKYVEFANPVQPIEPTASETIAQFQAAQLERAKTYGIGVKDKIGYVQKPDAYSDLTDEMFADPVNYLYPIYDLPNLLASKETFRSWDSSYTDIERQIILAKFFTAFIREGIDVTQELHFTEKPVEKTTLPVEEKPPDKENLTADIKPTDKEILTVQEPVKESLEFSISLKDSMKRAKPSIYSELKENDFADPVHYKFPLSTTLQTKSSMAVFSKDNVRSQYTEKEQEYISSRILLAALNHKINPMPQSWKYVDVPAEKLSRQQLIDHVKAQSVNDIQNNKNKYQQTNTGEKSMEQWFNDFVQAMTQQLTDSTNNQEIATIFQSAAEQYVVDNPIVSAKPADAATPTSSDVPVTPAPHSEPEMPKEWAEKIEKLEAENREMKLEEYYKEQLNSGKLIPAQKELVKNLFEAMRTNDKTLEFSEGNKKVTKTIEETFKGLISSFPAQIEFTELATNHNAPRNEQVNSTNFSAPEGMITDPEADKLNQKVKQFMESQIKQGNTYSYKQALEFVLNQDK